MMVKLALILSLLTIVTLNAILWVAASSNSQVIGNTSWFSLLVNMMYFALISSSLLLGYLNWQKSHKAWAFIFWANIFIVLIPTILNMFSLLKLPRELLILLDLYWLNKYLVYTLSSYGLLNPAFKRDAQ